MGDWTDHDGHTVKGADNDFYRLLGHEIISIDIRKKPKRRSLTSSYMGSCDGGNHIGWPGGALSSCIRRKGDLDRTTGIKMH